jgi:hypothetical protein
VNANDKKPRVGPKIAGGAPDARQRAAAILDVLAGERTPAQAAASIGLSLARYFAVESQALSGLVKACEPRPKGYRKPLEKQMAQLRKDLQRTQRERDRLQALLRTTQRAVALGAPPAAPRKKHARKRPMVRALRAAAVLRSAPTQAAPPQEVTPAAP